MFKSYTIKTILVLAVVAVFGIGSNAFAGRDGAYDHRGYGPHHGYGMNDGHGRHGYGGGYGPGCDDRDDLTREEIETLEKQDRAFDKETAKLRRNMYQKQLALRSELAEENPDAKKASKLQKELSDFRAEFDQKRLDYEINARKTAPNAGKGRMKGYGVRGYGDCRR